MVLRNFYNQLSELKLDKNERKFVDYFNFKKLKERENVLLVVPNDYYYVCYNYLLSKERVSKFNVFGYWPYSVHVKRIRLFQNIHEIKSDVYFNLLKNKYFNLYKPIGLQALWNLEDLKKQYINKLEDKTIKSKAIKIFNKIKNKKEILNLYIDEIYCGDLIYDSYIRFRNRPTVDIKDKFLGKIIYLTILSIKCFEKFQKNYNFKSLYTSYATFIHFGLLVRVFLKMKVKVYSGATISTYNKKLTVKDPFHVENFRKFNAIYAKLNNKTKRIKESKIMLDKIFYKNRKNLQFNDYMNVDPFKVNKKKLKKNYDGMIFLPNFFETQREWGKLVFPDFYEWINFTCDFICKHSLNIAIKPHPNIYYEKNNESVKIVKFLKKKYKRIDWIDPSISNFEIFKNIKCGISPWGTILWELAYFNVHSISAGEHPACKYNIGFEPRSIKEYKRILLSINKLKVKKRITKRILEFCYMYYIHNHDSFKTTARTIKLNKIDFKNSSSLKKFIEIYKSKKNN